MVAIPCRSPSSTLAGLRGSVARPLASITLPFPATVRLGSFAWLALCGCSSLAMCVDLHPVCELPGGVRWAFRRLSAKFSPDWRVIVNADIAWLLCVLCIVALVNRGVDQCPCVACVWCVSSRIIRIPMTFCHARYRSHRSSMWQPMWIPCAPMCSRVGIYTCVRAKDRGGVPAPSGSPRPRRMRLVFR